MSVEICRLCMNRAPVLYSLFENDGVKLVESITSLKIEEDDDLPKSACVKCWLNIKWAYNIRQGILEVNQKFYTSTLKQETHSDMSCQDCFSDSEEPNIGDEVLSNTIKIENFTDSEFAILVVKEQTPCHICNENVIDKMAHLKEHFDSEQFCSDCQKVFENMDAYKEHLTTNHKNIKKLWTCEHCLATFRYKPLYEIHSEKAHKNGNSTSNKAHYLRKKLGIKSVEAWRAYIKEDQSHKCDQCGKEFTTMLKVKNHIRNCHSPKQCPICGKLMSAPNFIKHVQSHNSVGVVCDICGSVLKNSESLRSHLQYTHSTKQYPCPDCGAIFSKSYSRLLHVKKLHTGERNHICEECGKSFLTYFTLNKHVQVSHRKLRRFECTYCKKKFSSKYAVRTHERQHTNECPYVCSHCGEGFRQNISLRNHMKSKHNVEEEKSVKCKACDKMFISKHALKTHVMRLHWENEWQLVYQKKTEENFLE